MAVLLTAVRGAFSSLYRNNHGNSACSAAVFFFAAAGQMIKGLLNYIVQKGRVLVCQRHKVSLPKRRGVFPDFSSGPVDFLLH